MEIADQLLPTHLMVVFSSRSSEKIIYYPTLSESSKKTSCVSVFNILV